MFSLICAWINSWVNNGEAGDLRCHRAHYEIIVMEMAAILSGGYELRENELMSFTILAYFMHSFQNWSWHPDTQSSILFIILLYIGEW